ncbi:MAG: hypothetical protein C0490_25910 [Marivirga sp.]|nr:hypothetical protein [Marivirga sp.]
MSKKLSCILLIDDNHDDNFFHDRVIRKSKLCDKVVARTSAQEALDYLASTEECIHPDIIFLDINMPRMNGWEFLEEYAKMDKMVHSRVIIVMLTTSENPDDKIKANDSSVIAEFRTKPLTKEMLEEMINKYF